LCIVLCKEYICRSPPPPRLQVCRPLPSLQVCIYINITCVVQGICITIQTNVYSILCLILQLNVNLNLSSNETFKLKLLFSNHYIFATRCTFDISTMNFAGLISQSFKPNTLTPIDCNDLWIIKFEFKARAQQTIMTYKVLIY